MRKVFSSKGPLNDDLEIKKCVGSTASSEEPAVGDVIPVAFMRILYPPRNYVNFRRVNAELGCSFIILASDPEHLT